MDAKRNKQILSVTNSVSISKGGNKLFRIGVFPSKEKLISDRNKQKRFIIKPRKYTGNFFYHLKRGAVCHGYFWRHNGPTASWLYFKIRIQDNDDKSTICYHYSEKINGVK